MANKEFISQTLCENKNKPEKHCEGQCQLKKNMEKEDKKTAIPSAPETAVFITDLPSPLDFCTTFKVTSEFISFYSMEYQLILSTSIFHPPGLDSDIS